MLLESKGNCAFKKAGKDKGGGKPTLSMRRFPLSLFIYPKLCSFGLLLKMRCIFFTEQSFTDRRFCRLCNQFLPKTLRFSLQRHKSSRIRLEPNSWDNMPVLALELGTLFPDLAYAESVGFGLGLLVSSGFLGAKAGHSDQRFGRLCNQFLPKTLRFSLQRHKTPEFGFAEFWDCLPDFLWRNLVLALGKARQTLLFAK